MILLATVIGGRGVCPAVSSTAASSSVSASRRGTCVSRPGDIHTNERKERECHAPSHHRHSCGGAVAAGCAPRPGAGAVSVEERAASRRRGRDQADHARRSGPASPRGEPAQGPDHICQALGSYYDFDKFDIRRVPSAGRGACEIPAENRREDGYQGNPTSAAAASTTSVSASAAPDSVKRALTSSAPRRIRSSRQPGEEKPVCTSTRRSAGRRRRADHAL